MTVTNLLLVIVMVALPISGIIMSRYAFSFLQITGGVGTARTVHLLTSYWGFVLMSFHAGLHGQNGCASNQKITFTEIFKVCRRVFNSDGCYDSYLRSVRIHTQIIRGLYVFESAVCVL